MIGHSFPTLEELPYIPIMLDNRTISFLVLCSSKGDYRETGMSR
jgi:hypothetical protein